MYGKVCPPLFLVTSHLQPSATGGDTCLVTLCSLFCNLEGRGAVTDGRASSEAEELSRQVLSKDLV